MSSTYEKLISDYKRHRLEWQPWLNRGDLSDDYHIWYELLKSEANANISEGAFISRDARVFTDKLSIGKGSYIASNSLIRGSVSIGAYSSINVNCQVAGRVSIENHVRIGAGCMLLGFNHVYSNPNELIAAQGLSCVGITIGSDVWLGSNAVILDGTVIPDGSVIAAGAVVSKGDYIKNCVLAGNPARIVKIRGGI